MSKRPETADTLSITNTKLAASMIALGFDFTAELVQPTRKGEKLHTQFLFRGIHHRPLFAHIRLDCAKKWEEGTLEKEEPMHPLCVMMRAQENRDRLLDWQKQGIPHGLRSIPATGGQMLIYRKHGYQSFTCRTLTLEDLDLAASLAGVGIPVIDIEGSDGMHRYVLPQHGFARLDEQGVPFIECAFTLVQGAPTPEDPRRLLLEETNPLHPVALGYDALNVRAWLKKGLETTRPLLLIQEEGTDKQALITSTSTGRVMQQVERHLGSPAMKW
jgi:hypothetical protein